ncbi:DinB family protein [Mucilaginibacter limnophilus]|nr:DinB family protein [Mucilaginibacter limnophilus]
MEITEERKTKLLDELSGTLQSFIDEAALFNNQEFNSVPYPGSWTPGQCAQHIRMSASGFNDVLNGRVTDTNREPDAGVEQIKAQFLNFDLKMQSPDFVVPEEKAYDQEEMIQALKVIRENVLNSVQSLDLDKTCISFKVPGAGWFTRFEAASFVLYHTQRHVHQLKKMQKAFEEEAV